MPYHSRVSLASILDREKIKYDVNILKRWQKCIAEPKYLGDLDQVGGLCNRAGHDKPVGGGEIGPGGGRKGRWQLTNPELTLEELRRLHEELLQFFACFETGCFDMMVHFQYHCSTIFMIYFDKKRESILPGKGLITVEVRSEHTFSSLNYSSKMLFVHPVKIACEQCGCKSNNAHYFCCLHVRDMVGV